MLKLIKSLFVKSVPAVVELAPARGVIATAESELFIVELIHTGGNWYEITARGRFTKNGSGVSRQYESRARSHFDFYCSLHGAK